MHAQGAAFPHGHNQAPHLAALTAAHAASPYGYLELEDYHQAFLLYRV